MNQSKDRNFRRHAGVLLLITILIAGGAWVMVYTTQLLQQADGTAMYRSATWTCIKHPDVRQPAPGRCPKCGRLLWPEDDGARPATTDQNTAVYAETPALGDQNTVRTSP